MTQKKILIVDDAPENLIILAQMLEEEFPFSRIIQTNSAKKALEIALIEIPDIIITDWNMPEESGIDLIKAVNKQELLMEIPVIVATGIMMNSEDMKLAFDSGAKDYIRKPYNQIELAVRCKSLMEVSSYKKQIFEKSNKSLAESALLLIKSNEFNLNVSKKLLELQKKIRPTNLDIAKEIEFLIFELDDKIKVDSWQRFQLSFETTHQNFSKNLLKQYPFLTSSELKLSIFLKLGMNTKDIASVLYQSSDSVKVSRSRLRKKLSLTTDQNLQVFLSTF